MWTIYLPLSPYYLFLSLKHRDFGFFAHVNPSMPTGGMALFEKSTMYALLPEHSYPRFVKLALGQKINTETFSLQPPLVIKPECGCRGRGVVMVDDVEHLLSECNNIKEPIIIQERCVYPLEAGIFYVSIPGQKGKITGIVAKKGIEVIGNGKNTIGELLRQSSRYVVHAERYNGHTQINDILPTGETLELSTIGNHARGATFYDESFRIDDQLTSFIDQIAKNIPEFHYGRFDIRFESWDKLKQGKDWTIIELNGANSEPTHVYDPSHSYFYALKEFYRHWSMMSRICSSLKSKERKIPFYQLVNMLTKRGHLK